MAKVFLFGLCMWIAGLAAVIGFWVWLGTFLIWKILAIVGAGLLVWPSFITMVSGGLVFIALTFAAAVIED